MIWKFILGAICGALTWVVIESIFANRRGKYRMNICRTCQHFTKVGTCGTPVWGERLPNGEELCGCVMKVKTKLKRSKCPIGKW